MYMTEIQYKVEYVYNETHTHVSMSSIYVSLLYLPAPSPPQKRACWSIMVRVCPHSAGGFSPVVAWAVHVSVGKEIQRVTIASGGRERGN